MCNAKEDGVITGGNPGVRALYISEVTGGFSLSNGMYCLYGNSDEGLCLDIYRDNGIENLLGMYHGLTYTGKAPRHSAQFEIYMAKFAEEKAAELPLQEDAIFKCEGCRSKITGSQAVVLNVGLDMVQYERGQHEALVFCRACADKISRNWDVIDEKLSGVLREVCQ